MKAVPCAVKEWMDEHYERMMVCPNQPGALLLSKSACVRRYLAAQEETYEDMMLVDFFRYKVKKGLYLCRNCPVGARLASRRAATHVDGRLEESPKVLTGAF